MSEVSKHIELGFRVYDRQGLHTGIRLSRMEQDLRDLFHGNVSFEYPERYYLKIHQEEPGLLCVRVRGELCVAIHELTAFITIDRDNIVPIILEILTAKFGPNAFASIRVITTYLTNVAAV